MRKRLNFPDRESLSRMTNEDAQKIVSYISTYEFPLLYDFSLRYAIFKVGSHVSLFKMFQLHFANIDANLLDLRCRQHR